MADKGRIARNTAFLSVAHGASKVFSVALTALATRILGPAGYGFYVTGNSFIEVARVLASSGLDYLVTREVAVDPTRASRVASSATAVKLMLGAVAYSALALIVWRLDYPQPLLQVVLILGVIVFLENLSDIADAVFQGVERMDYTTRTMLVSSVAIFLLGASALLAGLGLVGFVAGVAAGCVVRTVVGLTLLRRRFAHISPAQVEREEVRRLARAAVPLMGATVISLLFHRVDIIMLSRLTGEVQWGLYGVAVRVVDVVVLAPRILATAVYPQLRKAREDGTAPTVSLMVGSTRLTLVLCSALALAVWGLAPVAVGLIGGAGYGDSVPALQILAWAVVLQAGCHMLVRLLFAAEREKDLLPIGAMGVACNVVLNALWIPRQGIEGAALATVVSYGLTLALYYLYAWRAGYRVPLWSSAGGALTAVGLAAAAAHALPLAGTAARALAAVAVWVLALALLRVTGPAQLREGLRRLRRGEGGD